MKPSAIISDRNYGKNMVVFQILGSKLRSHHQSAQPGFQILKGLSLIHIRDGHANLFQMIPRAHVNDDTITTAGWWWCTLVEVSCFSDQNRFPKYVSMSTFLKNSEFIRQNCHILKKNRWLQNFSRIILLTLFQEFWLKMEQHWEFDWLFTRILVEFWSHLVWWQRK